MKDLNKQYFETRRTHKKNFKRWGWILWVGMFMFAIVQVYMSIRKQQTEMKTFDLAVDHFDFSNKLKDGDTLQIIANISVCASHRVEKDIITKEKGKVYIQSEAAGFLIDEWHVVLPKKEYQCNASDSLNFENLFRYVAKKGTEYNSTYANTFRIIYRQDTIRYYSNGLSEQVPNSGYYLSIKRQLYPDHEIYEPMEVPPPPPEPPFDKSMLPDGLITFALSEFKQYRVPTVNDYPEYYFSGYANEGELPYYCSGHFNNDTILDHALLLVKDSTEQMILSIHQKEDVFYAYPLHKAQLVFDSIKNKWDVTNIIETEKGKVLEAIDTTYYINTNGIAITDMHESWTYIAVWDSAVNKYEDLYFD